MASLKLSCKDASPKGFILGIDLGQRRVHLILGSRNTTCSDGVQESQTVIVAPDSSLLANPYVQRDAPTATSTEATLVIATYNRPGSVATLLEDLRWQTSPSSFEVIVVNDGGFVDVEAEIPADLPFSVRVIDRENGGPARARHTGILATCSPIVIIVDDDMRIEQTFVSAHLASHAAGAEVVFGLITSALSADVPLFTAFHDQHINQWLAACESGEPPQGKLLCTGNVSFRREVYLAVGGFDLSLTRLEDRDLGIRLEDAGRRFEFAKAAVSTHVSDHADLAVWRSRSRLYGASDLAISQKYPARPELSPWSFLDELPKVTHPILIGVTLFPRASFVGAWTYRLATLAARLNRRQPAMKLTGFTYGIDYYAGVGEGWGNARQSLRQLNIWFKGRNRP